ncbi:MAG TPA: hypothetical protein PKY77_01365, partial [Phycisphaerae bacterium]|nr:hypothetical protein [Phycisphaerae bacterium]
ECKSLISHAHERYLRNRCLRTDQARRTNIAGGTMFGGKSPARAITGGLADGVIEWCHKN